MHRRERQPRVAGSQKLFYGFHGRALAGIPAAAAGGNAGGQPGAKISRRTSTVSVVTVLLLVLIFVRQPAGLAQDSAPTEYQIKAAFLYNFAKFVEWPPQAFADANAPIVIGVLGKNVFDNDLEKIIRGKTVNNRPFQFKEFHTVEEATNCQILFINASEKQRLPKILESLRGVNTLTVSETDQFLAEGGMVNFFIEDKKIHFQINESAVQKTGLKISSKLLSLAAHNH